jgi:allophanate hydrolase
VPACRSIDCVSIFALTSDDALRVAAVAGAYDRTDPYSRTAPFAARSATPPETSFRFGVPQAAQLEFFGDAEYARLFGEAVKRLESFGGERVDIDFAPFRAAAKLLYEAAWIAERYVAVGEFIERHPQSVHPVTRQLIEASRAFTAADAFRAHHSLMAAKRAAAEAWGDIDVLVTPTTGTIYRIAEIEADPIRLNANLGFYTNFVNFLDYAAVAVPAGFRRDGLPFGVTLVGPAWSDAALLPVADRLHRASVSTTGALDAPLPKASGAVEPFRNRSTPSPPSSASTAPPLAADAERIAVAVCGAHLEGLPLNPQLTSRGATLIRRTRTAPRYRFYALPGGPPLRPGLIRVAEGGASIEVEVWSVPAEHFGSFVAGIPAPLGIGKVELEDGERVCGFICEGHAAAGAEDITSLGGWRAFLSSKR